MSSTVDGTGLFPSNTTRKSLLQVVGGTDLADTTRLGLTSDDEIRGLSNQLHQGDTASLALILNKLFEGDLNSDSKLREFKDLLLEQQPNMQRDFNLLQGIKFYSAPTTVIKPVEDLTEHERESPSVKAQLSGGSKYINLTKERLAVFLPPSMMESTVDGVKALDLVATVINSLTEKWPKISMPVTINVVLRETKENQDRLLSVWNQNTPAWNYVLARLDNDKTYTAGLSVAITTPGDIKALPTGFPSKLKDFFQQTGINNSGVFSDRDLGPSGLALSPVLTSSGKIRFSLEKNIKDMIKDVAGGGRLERGGYLGAGGTFEGGIFGRYRTLAGDDNLGSAHSLDWTRLHGLSDGNAAPLNPLDSWGPRVLDMGESVLVRNGVKYLHLTQGDHFRDDFKSSLAQSLGLGFFAHSNNGTFLLKQVAGDEPSINSDPNVLPANFKMKNTIV